LVKLYNKQVIKKLLLFLLGLVFVFSTASKIHAAQKIYYFYGNGCPHCGVVDEYFSSNGHYDNYPIKKLEIYFNKTNALAFTKTMSDLGIPVKERGVPAIVIGDQVLIGDKPIIEQFTQVADKYLANTEVEKESESKDVALDLTLLSVVSASVVDAINPCAFAVLILLMSTVLSSGDSKRALKSGLFFAAAIFISYLLMGFGLYKALSIGNVSWYFFKIIGWLAIIVGLLNLKDWLWYGKGFLMEVPMSWRPKMKSIIRTVTSPVGAFGVGFVVSLFLLPCTSGPYVVILGMLAQKVNQLKAISYLVLYNLIFVSPMILITYAVYKGFDPKKAEQERKKRLRVLHLIAGLLMIGIGIIVLFGWI